MSYSPLPPPLCPQSTYPVGPVGGLNDPLGEEEVPSDHEHREPKGKGCHYPKNITKGKTCLQLGPPIGGRDKVANEKCHLGKHKPVGKKIAKTEGERKFHNTVWVFCQHVVFMPLLYKHTELLS